MADIVLLSVFWRCLSASTNHLAESSFWRTKVAASFWARSEEPFASISRSAYFLLTRSSGTEKRGIVKDSSPSFSSRTKSGTICCAWSV